MYALSRCCRELEELNPTSMRQANSYETFRHNPATSELRSTRSNTSLAQTSVSSFQLSKYLHPLAQLAQEPNIFDRIAEIPGLRAWNPA